MSPTLESVSENGPSDKFETAIRWADSLSNEARTFLQTARSLDTESRLGPAATRLRIAISGGGVCGLTTSIALALQGDDVTLFEAGPKIEAPGAGIQVPPNSSRLLFRLGLRPYLEHDIVHPKSFQLRRWDNGERIGRMKTIEFNDKYGAPYLQVNRGDLHNALYKRAKELGVQFGVNSKVAEYDLDTPSLTLESGEVVRADLVIACDGVRSLARERLLGRAKPPPEKAEYAAYRCFLPIQGLLEDPEMSWLVQEPHQNCWVGDRKHVQSYSMNGNTYLNVVWIAPLIPEREPSAFLPELRSHFKNWDPTLQNLLGRVSSATKWPVWMAQSLEKTVAPSGKFVIMGDAAHDMTPFLGQGAAMAVEDGYLLGLLLGSACNGVKDIPAALEIHEALRVPRTSAIKREALRNFELWSMPDSERQQRRDEAASGQEEDGGGVGSSPYIWSDSRGQAWLYGYDMERAPYEDEIRPYWSVWE